MAIQLIDNRSVNLQDQSLVRFKNTSIGLNQPLNIYVISDLELFNLSVKYLDRSSEDFKLYNFRKQTYSISVTNVCSESGHVDLQFVSFDVVSADTAQVVAGKIETQLLADTNYTDIQVTDSLITFSNAAYGSNPDGKFVDDDLSVFGQFYDITITDSAEDLEFVDELTLSNVQSYNQTKYVYKINLLFTPQTDTGDETDNIHNLHTGSVAIVADDIKTIINLEGTSEESNAAYIVTLQNFKEFITNEYYTAFNKSDSREDKKNQILLNTKRREYITQLLELTGFVGSYRSLIAALKFFGYGELLSLKEYWKDTYGTNTYKATDISNQVLSAIDKQLAGYKKTNQMSLVYQINTEKTDYPQYDSDGFPYYTNVLYDTEEVLVKFYALRNILERDFLPLNTKIVDITGEHQSILGIDVNVWIFDAIFVTTHLTANLDVKIDYDYESTDVEIFNHKVIVDAWSLEPDLSDPDRLNFKDNVTTAFFTDIYFEVEEELDTDNTDEVPYNILTKFHSSDFGMIRLNVAFGDDGLSDPSQYYYEYDAVVYSDIGVELFRTKRHSISEILSGMKIGIKHLGEFTIQLFLYDLYGGTTLLSSQDKVRISNRFTDFDIYRTRSVADKLRDIGLVSTFGAEVPNIGVGPDTDKVTIDPIDEGFAQAPTENLTWDQFTGIDLITDEQHIIDNYYKNGYDFSSTYKTVAELNSIPVSAMEGIPIEAQGYKYGTILVDIIADGSDGSRAINMKLFAGHDWSGVTFYYDDTYASNPEEFISIFVTELNNQVGIFDRFTYDLNYFSVDDTADGDVRPMLRIKAKDISMTTDMFYINVSGGSEPVFENAVSKNDIEVFMPLDATMTLYYNDKPDFDNIQILFDDVEYGQILAIPSIQALIDALNQIKTDNGLDYSVNYKESGGVPVSPVTVTSKKTMSISHLSVGVNHDIIRGFNCAALTYISAGSEVSRAEPVYAFINHDSKIDNLDVHWTLRNSLTNEVLTVQNSYAFRYVMTKSGSYSLELLTKDIYGQNQRNKLGCLLVK